MGCTSSSDGGSDRSMSRPDELKRTQQLHKLIATKLREDRMGVINKGMPKLERRLSCELSEGDATSPNATEEKDALQLTKKQRRKAAMVNAIKENKWMIFSSLDMLEDADMACLAAFMMTASRGLRRLHDAKSLVGPNNMSPLKMEYGEYGVNGVKTQRADNSRESYRQSRRMLEATDDMAEATDFVAPPPPPEDDLIVLKKKLSSRSVIKITTDRMDSSESIINITRKNSSRISIGSAGSNTSLQDTINAAMAQNIDDDIVKTVRTAESAKITNKSTVESANSSTKSALSSKSALSTASKGGGKKPIGLLSLTSNVVSDVEDINNYNIAPGLITMDTAKAIISCYKKNGKLSEKSLHKVLRLGYKSLKGLPNTTKVPVGRDDRLTVVGDIHGQIWDLLHILDENGMPSESNKYIFNGDFVDRGSFGVEVMCVLLAMHSACPEGVHLNRGNHEDFAICTVYGFQNECINKYDEVAFGMFCEIFNHLPLFAIIEDAVFVLHGGLFHSTDATLAELDSINRRNFSLGEIAPDTDSLDHIPRYKRDDYLKQLVRDALWSDPMTEGGLGFNPRGAGVAFGPDVTKAFLHTNNLKMIVRSHECIRTGFDLPYLGEEKDLLCTVFSASNYCGGDNSAAYMVFSHKDNFIGSAGSLNTITAGDDAIPVPVIDTDLVYRIYYYNINSQIEDEIAAELNSQISASTMSSDNCVTDMSFHDLIIRKKSLILEEFRAADSRQNSGTKLGAVTIAEWADVMQKVCKLQIRWTMMIPELVPDSCINGDKIDYIAFLKSFSDTESGLGSASHDSSKEYDAAGSPSKNGTVFDSENTDHTDADELPSSVIEALYTNHNKLDAMFRFFDQNCDGVISRVEFIDGCEILNTVLDEGEKLSHFESFLNLLDVDESGDVHINEFFEMFRLSEMHCKGRPEIASVPVIGSSKLRFSLSLGAAPRIASHRMTLTESFANNTAGPTTINSTDHSGKVMTINIDESPLLSPTIGKASEKRGGAEVARPLGYDI